VEVEVGADVAAAGAGEGRKRKWWCWWAAASVEKRGETSVEREKRGREDGCPAGGDSGGGGWRHGWEGERRERGGRKRRKTREVAGFSPGHQIHLYL